VCAPLKDGEVVGVRVKRWRDTIQAARHEEARDADARSTPRLAILAAVACRIIGRISGGRTKHLALDRMEVFAVAANRPRTPWRFPMMRVDMNSDIAVLFGEG
jgi:hypothetical protein